MCDPLMNGEKMSNNLILNLVKHAKSSFDLTDVSDQKSLYSLTDTLLNIPSLSIDTLCQIARDKETPLEFKIAVKLFKSKKFLMENRQPVKLGVLFAMWGEQNRLLPKTGSNPNGEDSLLVKLQQLKWATQGSSIKWMLYAIDDGCPHGSGKIATEIADRFHLGKYVKILHLAEALPQKQGPLMGLKSVDESRKGGAMILGALEAIKDGMDVIITTDSDNSVHLGQIGLLLQKFCNNQTHAVFGDRKDPDAILIKQENRWGVGIKLLRHIQRMIGVAIFSREIFDTQAAFKLFQCGLLEKIIQQPTVYDFAFDTDWIAATIAAKEPFEKVPFAFIDSFAESASITQGPMTTWEILLKGLVKQVRKYQLPHNQAMARIIDEEIQSSADLDLLINHLPPQLKDIPDRELGNPEIMNPEEILSWIQERKTR